MATEITRFAYNTSDDGLWANNAASGDAESAPDNGERDVGFQNGTVLTSGRLNYLMALLAELQQKQRDVVLPQHEDDGDHLEIIARSTSGVPVTAEIHSGAASSASILDLTVAGGSTVAKVTKAGDLTANTVGQTSTATRTRVIHGKALRPLSSGTAVYGSGAPTISYSDIDNTSRRFSVGLSGLLPTFAEIATVKVVVTPSDNNNTVDATLRSTDSGDNSTGTNRGTMSQITGSSGSAVSSTITNTAPADTYAGANGFWVDIDVVSASGSAGAPLIEKVVVTYTVGTLG